MDKELIKEAILHQSSDEEISRKLGVSQSYINKTKQELVEADEVLDVDNITKLNDAVISNALMLMERMQNIIPFVDNANDMEKMSRALSNIYTSIVTKSMVNVNVNVNEDSDKLEDIFKNLSA